MKPKPFGLLLLAIQAVLASGCATPAVWRAGSFARYCEPANPTDLALFDSNSRKDVLVEYSEIHEEGSKTQRRAYWLYENADRIRERRQPRFVLAKAEAGLAEIPIVQTSSSPDGSMRSGRYAMTSTNYYAFTLYSGGKEEGAYELPVYEDPSGRMKQILLTPPAVIADATIIGGLVALASLPWIWTGLNDWVH